MVGKTGLDGVVSYQMYLKYTSHSIKDIKWPIEMKAKIWLVASAWVKWPWSSHRWKKNEKK